LVDTGNMHEWDLAQKLCKVFLQTTSNLV
jgi:hypothetical protein